MMTRINNRISLPSPSSFFGGNHDGFDGDENRLPSLSPNGPDHNHQHFLPPPPPSECHQDASVSSSPLLRLRSCVGLRNNLKPNVFSWKTNPRKSASPRFGGLQRANSGLRSKQRVDNADIHERDVRGQVHNPAKPKFGLKDPPPYSIQPATPAAVMRTVANHGAPLRFAQPHNDNAQYVPRSTAPVQASSESNSCDASGEGPGSSNAYPLPATYYTSNTPSRSFVKSAKIMMPQVLSAGPNVITHPSRGFVKHPQLHSSSHISAESVTSPHQSGGNRSCEARPELPFRNNESTGPSSSPLFREQEAGSYSHEHQHRQYLQLQHQQRYDLFQKQGNEYHYQHRQSQPVQLMDPQANDRGVHIPPSPPVDPRAMTWTTLHPADATRPYSSVQASYGSAVPQSQTSFYTTTARRLQAPPEKSSVSPSTRSNEAVFVEIYPGVTERLRGAAETARAADINFVVPLQCISCTIDMLCIADAAYVICPLCRVVSPTVDRSLNDRWGVGLGFISPEDDPDADQCNQTCGF